MFSGLDTIQNNPTRRWTAILSFTLQAALVSAALVLPLFKVESLPDAFARRPIFRPSPLGERIPISRAVIPNNASPAPVYPLVVSRGPAIRTTDVGPQTSDPV